MAKNSNSKYIDADRPGFTESANYRRLVRDRIPEIIEAMGNIAVWHELTDDEGYGQALLSEVVRTSSRFSESESLETLSDLLEAIDAWLAVKGLTMEEVKYARDEKHKRCGGFEKRMFLEYVAPGTDVDKRTLTKREC